MQRARYSITGEVGKRRENARQRNERNLSDVRDVSILYLLWYSVSSQ